jgi:hypothetical protein
LWKSPNLACASGLPGTENLNISACSRELDSWAEQVHYWTQRCTWFKEKPEKYDYSYNLFRIHVMVSLLQKHFGVFYNPDCIPDDAIFKPQDTFIHGILQGTGGTCASLPVLYTAVGRRLGYSLKLISIPGHRLCRWDEPDGKYFNIETTNVYGFNNPTDEECRTEKWIPFTEEEQKECGWLKSLSPKQELSSFIMSRGFYYLDLGNYRQAVEDFYLASKLDEERPVAARSLLGTLKYWQKCLEKMMPPNCPRISFNESPRRYLNIPECVERQIISLEVLEDVLADPVNEYWWEMLRQFPDKRPSCVPKQIIITLTK